MRAIAHRIGPITDIPAPDVETDARVMAWMLDEYEKIVGHPEPAVITGKPMEKGGSAGREEAAGLGGAYILREVARLLRRDPPQLTVAVQGFVNVGSFFARWAAPFGFRVVALSDSKGGLYDRQGLDVGGILHSQKAGSGG
jgi:glutamate dehydrogenase/leucine dehydrogenase